MASVLSCPKCIQESGVMCKMSLAFTQWLFSQSDFPQLLHRPDWHSQPWIKCGRETLMKCCYCILSAKQQLWDKGWEDIQEEGGTTKIRLSMWGNGNVLPQRDSVSIVPLMFHRNLKEASDVSEDGISLNHMGRKDESTEEVQWGTGLCSRGKCCQLNFSVFKSKAHSGCVWLLNSLFVFGLGEG